MQFQTDGFLARPLDLTPTSGEDLAQKVWKSKLILAKAAAHTSYFSDYLRGCGGKCDGLCKDLSPACRQAKQLVAYTLMKPDTISWEVWTKAPDSEELVDFVGILRLGRVNPGDNAVAHYFFFDGKLKNKTSLLKAWHDWVFSDHPEFGWRALHRVTAEIPTDAFALARHAVKRLGMGGPFEYEFKGTRLPCEGVLKDAVTRHGEKLDILILGKIKD